MWCFTIAGILFLLQKCSPLSVFIVENHLVGIIIKIGLFLIFLDVKNGKLSKWFLLIPMTYSAILIATYNPH